MRAPFSKKRKSDERLAIANINFDFEFEKWTNLRKIFVEALGVVLIDANNNEITARVDFKNDRWFDFNL